MKIMKEGIESYDINFMKFEEVLFIIKANKYKINQKMYGDNENLNHFLFKGFYGECPPFVINLSLKSVNLHSSQDHPVYCFNISKLSDTKRLYYLLTCIVFLFLF